MLVEILIRTGVRVGEVCALPLTSNHAQISSEYVPVWAVSPRLLKAHVMEHRPLQLSPRFSGSPESTSGTEVIQA